MMPKPTDHVLEVNNIEVTYNKVVQALRGLSLAVPRGHIVALLGSNGAGKSSTLKAISNLLPLEERCPGRGRHPLQRPGHHRHRPAGAGAPGAVARDGRAAHVRGPDHRGKPHRRHLCVKRSPRRGPARFRPGVRLLPAPARAAPGAGRLPVGRRAADAGDWPRPDRPAQADPAGRAFAGPLAQADRGHLRHHRPHQCRARHVDAAGRAERHRGPGGGALRLHHGERQGRHRRHGRAPGRRPGRARVLPGHGRAAARRRASETSNTTSAASAGCVRRGWHDTMNPSPN